MSRYGGAAPWWRVLTRTAPALGHDAEALGHYLAEATPLRSSRPPVRVNMRQARWTGAS